MVLRNQFILLCCLLSSFLLNAQSEADIAFQKQDYQQAAILYQDCYEQDTFQLQCLIGLAKSFQKQGDNSSAKKNYHILEARDTLHDIYRKALAAIYEEEENPPKAIKYYTSLTKAYPENGVYARKLGRLYRQSGLMTDAFKYYKTAHRLNSRDIKSIRGLSDILLVNGQLQLADSMIQVGLALDSTHIGMNLLLARTKYRLKEYQEVSDVLQSVLGKYDFDAYYHKLYGFALTQIDSNARAIFHLNRALGEDPKNDKIHYYLGNAHLETGDKISALHHFEEAVKHGISTSMDNYYKSLAKYHTDEGNLKESIHAYKEVLRYGGKPINLYYLARASDLYYKDKGIAIRYYTKYIQSEDNSKEYKDYARARSQYLKEQRHQSK